MRRPALHRLAAIVAVPAVVAAAAQPAVATGVATKDRSAPTERGDTASLVDVVGTPDGFTLPESVPPGMTTFRVTTSDPNGIRLGLFRLNDGVDLDRFLVHLVQSIAGEGEEQISAGRAVMREAGMLGGEATVAGERAAFTQFLRPGRYHLIDYEDIEDGDADGPVAVEELTVTGEFHPGSPPLPDEAITMVDTPDGPRYRAPRVLSGDSAILVTNLTEQVDEAIFMRVRPGTTRADVQGFFEALDRDEGPPEYPFVGLPHGMPVISPGHAEIIQPDLPRGRYALITWVPDLDDGGMHAADGMHTLVTVR
ncbi:MAG: hypothetical protein GEU93_17040 [Propionibacteriales bacterium]|nr:hypothetical protein [Propionibacteriales bacterium]